MKLFKKVTYSLIQKILYSGYFGIINLNQNLFKHLPDKLETYIDVGAFDGAFFDLVSAEKKINSAILIEPQKILFEDLKKKYQKINSIQTFNVFLSDKIETRPFYINKLGATSSTFEFDTQLMENQLDLTCIKKEELTTTTLDLIIPKNILKIDLLKIDVQGAELLVLKGASSVLNKTQFIFLEISLKKIYSGIPTFEEIQDWLNSKGFILLEITPAYKSKQDELLQVDCLFKKIKE